MKWVLYLATCMCCALLPLLQADGESPKEVTSYEFIKTFQRAHLQPLDMSVGEREFYSDFPGATGYFALDGRPGENVFLRYTEQTTRKLHAAEGCYRASGYELEYANNVTVLVDELADSPIQWSQFKYSEGNGVFLVRQCIISLNTRTTYADIPAWYWQTTFSSDDPGPWLAVTWKLPEEAEEQS